MADAVVMGDLTGRVRGTAILLGIILGLMMCFDLGGPVNVLGGATTGALVAGLGIELRAPHGGVFVFFAISNFLLFLLAVAVGMVVGALAVTVAKSVGRPKSDDVPEDAVDLAHAHNPTAVSASAASA